ncbi:PspC domain-containing protein [Pseudactinotalea sp. Z1748]|uniref:ATP-binding protein n=1 Tax=Pseudactinotalea sp. Z1748 TaxID=3413027 RepID=UPI003C7C869E
MNAPAPAVASSRARPPLRRPERGRILSGVCAGLAVHLDVPVRTIRWIFALTTLAAGAGALMYLWLALTVPHGSASAQPPRLARLIPALRTPATQGVVGQVSLGGILLLIAASLVAIRFGVDAMGTWLLPVVVLLAGAALAWSQLDSVGGAGAGNKSRSAVLVRVGGGVALSVVGVVLLIGQGQGAGQVLRGLLAGMVVLAGAALVLAPWWLRLWRELIAERAARARESERADIAAHLHDSVLQTLSLIRSRSHDPGMVQRLARAQERELRDWLYRDRPEPGDSIAADLSSLAAEVEDLHGAVIDVVTAGDGSPSAGTEPLMAATREALVNAVVHGAAPVSLYVQVNETATEVFVRDRGEGFDTEQVGADRHGVRDSIIGRMRRHGGSAQVRSDPGRGTEVHLRMPVNGGKQG